MTALKFGISRGSTPGALLDRRKVLFRTTPEGDDIAATTRTQRHAWLDAQLHALSPEDQRAIARACALLSGIADS